MAYKRIYIGIGMTIIALFTIISQIPGVEIQVSDDIYCAGTIENPCISYLNITSTLKDIFVYNKDNIELQFTPEIKEYKLERKWGNYWREVNFSQKVRKDRLYNFKFVQGTKYQFRLIGYKLDSKETIKWSIDAGNTIIDPVWFGINISKIEECNIIYWNTTQNIYKDFTFNFACPSDYFNYTLNPKYAWCWNYLSWNNSFTLNFSHSFLYGNISGKIIWWNESIKIGEKIIENNKPTCRTIGYKIKDKNLYFKKFVGCSLDKDNLCVICDSKRDGNADGIIQSGESYKTYCIINSSIQITTRDDAEFLIGFDLE